MASPSEGYPTVVEWGKETIDLRLVPANGVKGLKAELEEKTGVPNDRMKCMPKSKGALVNSEAGIPIGLALPFEI